MLINRLSFQFWKYMNFMKSESKRLHDSSWCDVNKTCNGITLRYVSVLNIPQCIIYEGFLLLPIVKTTPSINNPAVV